jgi:hypothetical protein
LEVGDIDRPVMAHTVEVSCYVLQHQQINRTYPSPLVEDLKWAESTPACCGWRLIWRRTKSVRVMGMALCQPIWVDYGDGYVDFELIDQPMTSRGRSVGR